MRVKKGRIGKKITRYRKQKRRNRCQESEIERRLRQAGNIRFKLATRPAFRLQSNFSISFVVIPRYVFFGLPPKHLFPSRNKFSVILSIRRSLTLPLKSHLEDVIPLGQATLWSQLRSCAHSNVLVLHAALSTASRAGKETW